MSPNLTLYLALALYAAGTLVALASLFAGKRLQTPGLVLMLAGFVSHTAAQAPRYARGDTRHRAM